MCKGKTNIIIFFFFYAPFRYDWKKTLAKMLVWFKKHSGRMFLCTFPYLLFPFSESDASSFWQDLGKQWLKEHFRFYQMNCTPPLCSVQKREIKRIRKEKWKKAFKTFTFRFKISEKILKTLSIESGWLNIIPKPQMTFQTNKLISKLKCQLLRWKENKVKKKKKKTKHNKLYLKIWKSKV